MAAVRKHIDVRLADLLMPDIPEGMHGLPPGAALEVYRWMIATAEHYRDPGRWGSSGPWEPLLGAYGCVNCTPWNCSGLGALERHGGRWGEALRYRIGKALLLESDEGEAIGRWRRDHKLVDLRATIHVPARHYRPLWTGPPLSAPNMEKVLSAVLGLEGGRLRSPLNDCHPGAMCVHGVALATVPEGHGLHLYYGYDGSEWCETLARQGKREVFDDFFLRGVRKLVELAEVEMPGEVLAMLKGDG